MDAFRLLADIPDDVDRLLAEAGQTLRNKSVFAHGVTRLAERDFGKLRAFVLGLYDRLAEVERFDRAEVARRHVFLTLAAPRREPFGARRA